MEQSARGKTAGRVEDAEELDPQMTLRGRTYHLRMRTPARFASVEKRGEITRSLRTMCQKEARQVLPAVKAAVLAELDRKLVIGISDSSREAFNAAMSMAASRGLVYRSTEELAEGPLERILRHVEALGPRAGSSEEKVLLGAVDVPNLRLSGLADVYEQLRWHENRAKNLRQSRVWRNPKRRAAKNLIEALGEDKEVLSIEYGDALAHKEWWRKRMVEDGVSADTANKDFTHMSSMLKAYYESLKLQRQNPYANVSLSDRLSTKGTKLPIPVNFVRERWLADGALNVLNDEARDILLISHETGCRQSEIHDAPPDAFRLDAEVPHLLISNQFGEDRREIKNGASHREVPLLGLALAAARRHPQGFPRYRGKAGYSNYVNKMCRKHGLFPSPQHTCGGTRHEWENRLRDLDLPNDDRAALMGHSVESARHRELYGGPMPVEEKARLIRPMLLPVPAYLA